MPASAIPVAGKVNPVFSAGHSGQPQSVLLGNWIKFSIRCIGVDVKYFPPNAGCHFGSG
jgi:hypothetical protein